MTSVAALSAIVFVVSTSVQSQRAPLPHHSKFIPKAVAHHWHDQKELGGHGDKDTRGHQLRAAGPPHLRPEQPASWHVWARHSRLSNSEKETLRVRAHLLQDKLKLSSLAAKRVGPGQQQARPKTEGQPRVKRAAPQEVAAELTDNDDAQAAEPVTRQKRENVWLVPKLKKGVEDKWEDSKGPPSIEMHFYNPDIYFPENIAALENETGPYQEILRRERQKRPKRQTLYWPGRALGLQRVRRTTANPFIPDTNIEDYHIGSADTGEQYVPDGGLGEGTLTDSYVLSETTNFFTEIRKMLSNLKNWMNTPINNAWHLVEYGSNVHTAREKRSPRMSKLKKKQKLEKKRRKKKKQQKLTPRQIKHYRRIREHREERRKILHKRLKEKRRIRHKKLGTGPYNQSIIDYYGVYFDSSSSQLNDSLYDSIYDSSALDADQIYEDNMKNYTDSYDASDSDEDYSSEADEDGVISGDDTSGGDDEVNKNKESKLDVERKNETSHKTRRKSSQHDKLPKSKPRLNFKAQRHVQDRFHTGLSPNKHTINIRKKHKEGINALSSHKVIKAAERTSLHSQSSVNFARSEIHSLNQMLKETRPIDFLTIQDTNSQLTNTLLDYNPINDLQREERNHLTNADWFTGYKHTSNKDKIQNLNINLIPIQANLGPYWRTII